MTCVVIYNCDIVKLDAILLFVIELQISFGIHEVVNKIVNVHNALNIKQVNLFLMSKC